MIVEFRVDVRVKAFLFSLVAIQNLYIICRLKRMEDVNQRKEIHCNDKKKLTKIFLCNIYFMNSCQI